MVWMVNNTSRAYNVGGVVMSPFNPVQLDDSYLDHPEIKALMDEDSENKGPDGKVLKSFAKADVQAGSGNIVAGAGFTGAVTLQTKEVPPDPPVTQAAPTSTKTTDTSGGTTTTTTTKA